MKIFNKFIEFGNFANNRLQKASFCILLFAASVLAQEFNMNNMPPPEASMHYSLGALTKGSSVTVDITIPDNWHVNANVAADEFLKPSSIEIAAQGIHFGEPKWPEPIKEYSEALDLENLVFKGHFQITLPIENVDADYDSLTTQAIFHYQACDNSICLAPSQVTFGVGPVGFNKKRASRDDAGNMHGSATSTDANGNATGNVINAPSAAGNATEGAAGTFILLLSALFGGLILNLMPCVLPVLSLKLFSLIKQAGESRKRLLVLGTSTTLGILASFWALAGIVAAVKAGGGNAGWGMQFQSAGFIAFMVVILSAFAMSFFGVFEIWLPGSATTKMDKAGRKQGFWGAFFTGSLLVLLSTPCSAPFLGTAMGFAFTASTPVLFLFFTAAGVGLALPYMLVSTFPKILKVFPKPGAWMVTLQKIMGVLLLGTVVWLLWVVHEQAGNVGVGIFAAISLLSIAMSFAIGNIAPPGVAFFREVLSVGGAVVILAIIWFAFASPKFEAEVDAIFKARSVQLVTEDGWYRYTPELIEEFAKSGRTVFIDATADWCLTCKANEAAVLNRDDFKRAMDSLNVARVKADWTRETPEVTALLRSMGKSGVPAYAIYPAGDASKQIVLPELLTTSAIVEKIVTSY
ncbi:thiol:disulfide interchange protein DsbD [Fibrobacter sp. UWB16]|uniref:protein-disulfide reductase DsbD family protein n=1 Tax=Fibrobacter sp. UWB3 TaxID=1964357 RepID=UPI000BD8AC99|nr:thioredoxin family protein [Fibrobacter sp. UWB3]SOD15561.1 thiol:disulfide interchange protein DsbD [Fibrobacter sp. UWB16]